MAKSTAGDVKKPRPKNDRSRPTFCMNITFPTPLVTAYLDDEGFMDLANAAFNLSNRSQLVTAALQEWIDNHVYLDGETGEWKPKDVVDPREIMRLSNHKAAKIDGGQEPSLSGSAMPSRGFDPFHR